MTSEKHYSNNQKKGKTTLQQNLYLMLLQSKQFYKTLINSQIKWNGSVYTAQMLCPMFIGLLNVITWVYKSSSYFRVFWLSLLENNRKKYQYWLSLSVRYVSTVLNLYPFCRESWRKVSRASWPSILPPGLDTIIP